MESKDKLEDEAQVQDIHVEQSWGCGGRSKGVELGWTEGNGV